MDEQIEALDECMYVWMDGWMDGWTNRRRVHKHKSRSFLIYRCCSSAHKRTRHKMLVAQYIFFEGMSERLRYGVIVELRTKSQKT